MKTRNELLGFVTIFAVVSGPLILQKFLGMSSLIAAPSILIIAGILLYIYLQPRPRASRYFPAVALLCVAEYVLLRMFARR